MAVEAVSFEEGRSESGSDSEVDGYTGDIETYIGDDGDITTSAKAPEISEAQLIQIDEAIVETDLTDEKSQTNNSNSITGNNLESENIKKRLSSNSITEIANKLEHVDIGIKPGKPVQIQTDDTFNINKLYLSDSEDTLAGNKSEISNYVETAEKSFSANDNQAASVEMFDPLSQHNGKKYLDKQENSKSVDIKKSKKSQVSRRKRPRHRIYLDDPDIHQLISDQVNLLKQMISNVKAGKATTLTKAQTQYLPGQQNLLHVPSTHSKAPYIPQNKKFNAPYSPHSNNIRGKNIITRIRNEDYRSSSADDDDEDNYTEQHSRSQNKGDIPYQLCQDCGEYHSLDEEDDICPDCGVVHNPYQHSPVKGRHAQQKEGSGYSPPPSNHSNSKFGKQYQQLSTQQDPDDTPQDTLPSIDGPLTVNELTEGYRYRLKYLGSCQIVTQHPVTKETRMQQAQDAYNRIKVQDDDNGDDDEVSTNVDMCISLERIKIINCDTKHEDIMMDHALRTVCFICDMGKILVLMARRLTSENKTDFSIEEGKPISLGSIVGEKEKKSSKNICHVFEGLEDASTIAKAIGQAFNVAYRSFLQSNGIAHEHVEEAEYCHVLESQKLVGTDLDKLTDESAVRDVVVVKKRGEALGIMLLESGWGSMLPTVFVAHIANYSAAAQSQKISVGDHILACNGASLVGLPLSECITILKNCRSSNRVSFRAVSCPPVVDVVVSRPDAKYQLGFSVQNGTICSLLRGGIAERGGVRVGHRIIEINGDSVVAKPHQHIVDILATTIGSMSMKTMPIAMYRLMVGDDQPQHV